MLKINKCSSVMLRTNICLRCVYITCTAAASILTTLHIHVQCLSWIMQRVRGLSSGHPVAEVFLIGWAFVYMIEGAAGFGTPVALAAPLLVSLGHPAIESISVCLIMNTLATPCALTLCTAVLTPSSVDVTSPVRSPLR